MQGALQQGLGDAGWVRLSSEERKKFTPWVGGGVNKRVGAAAEYNLYSCNADKKLANCDLEEQN